MAVVGCHRSGTSAVAGTLAHLGLDLGPELLGAGSDGSNPTGHWESLPLVRVHDQLLRRKDLAWDTEVLPEHQPRKWGALRARTQLVNILRQCRGDVFALKDPRMCLFPELWVEVAYLAGIQLAPLYVYRSAKAIVASLQERNQFTLRHATAVAGAYFTGMRKWNQLAPAGYEITYTGLLEDWRLELEEALEVLGMSWSVSMEQAAAVESFLNPELNHHG